MLLTSAGEQRPKPFPSLHGLYVKPLSLHRRAVAKLFRAKTGLFQWLGYVSNVLLIFSLFQPTWPIIPQMVVYKIASNGPMNIAVNTRFAPSADA